MQRQKHSRTLTGELLKRAAREKGPGGPRGCRKDLKKTVLRGSMLDRVARLSSLSNAGGRWRLRPPDLCVMDAVGAAHPPWHNARQAKAADAARIPAPRPRIPINASMGMQLSLAIACIGADLRNSVVTRCCPVEIVLCQLGVRVDAEALKLCGSRQMTARRPGVLVVPAR